MATIIHNQSRMRGSIAPSLLAKGMALGILAGLAGTFIMDLCMMATSWMLGLGAAFCFSAVGDTVAQFFSFLSIQIAGGVPLGVATPYLVGSLIGAVYGAGAAKFPSLRTSSLKKSIGWAVLYVEIAAQPMVWMTPILLKMALSDALEWFGGALMMHLAWGIVLGVMVHYGFRLAINKESL